jgi:hypothetical protein
VHNCQHGLLPSPRRRGHAAAHTLHQNALFNSALRQSTSIRKDLDQFADTAAPSPHLQAQLNASLTSFARTIDDYGKLAKQEPVQTKQEKAFERLKTFRGELDEYRASFKRIKTWYVCDCTAEGRKARSVLTRTLCTANHRGAHRTARPPPPPRRHAREPLCAAQRSCRGHVLAVCACPALRPLRALPTQCLLGRRSTRRQLRPRGSRAAREHVLQAHVGPAR